MKIAIPIQNNSVDDHFGHCEYYAIYQADENRNIVKKEILKSPQGCGCKSNIASILQKMDVKVLLAGNMGMGALNMLISHGIEVIRGCSGISDELVYEFLDGKLLDEDIVCTHHGENCNH